MAKATISVLFLILFFISVGISALVNGEENYWCVAKPSSEEILLKNNVDYACTQPNVNCDPVLGMGGPCFYPNTAINHASVAMNLYYQAYKFLGPSACDFGQSGLLSIKDPSYHDCVYALVPGR
ncbi:OLC1v1023357C1 [Oldenlandia corymbosa var. corymbosa]|uniref:OLC1v1023357C1 n=1 Tax=Oldenlandia corymbosa var. corymbosa TaxID=529605 RepID=A0AAV1C2Q4_OLDCO|nr:OLC1v1023357C1 [Oldenlandia corymbosa var. corymbosa]